MTDYEQLPLPPYVAGSDTSLAAAIAKKPTAAKQRAAVYRYLVEHGPRTQEELSAETGIGGDSARPRIAELRREGHVVDSGQRRLTRSGRQAVVWAAVSEDAA